MTVHTKPWAELDDDVDAATPEANAAHALHAGMSESAGRRSERRFAAGLFSTWQDKLRLDARWAMLPIFLGALWACTALLSIGSVGNARWHVLGTTILGAIACMVVVTSRSGNSDRAGSAQAAARRNVADKLGLSDAGDAQTLWNNIESHTANIERRIAELVNEQGRLQLESSLAAAQKRNIESILNALLEPVLVVDRYDHVVLINRSGIELFESTYTPEARQALGQLVNDEKLIQAVRQAREADSRVARRRIDLDFSNRAFALSITPLTDSAQESELQARTGTHGIVVVFRDVTRERLAAKAKSEFVAHVSHELRTPLSSIRAYTEMLVDGEAANEKIRSEYYGIIQASADRLGRLIDNMLNISRIEAGTVRINKEPVAVSIIVKEVVDSLKPQADEKKIALTTDLAPVVDRVMADRDLLYQAVLNLVSNAIKYTPDEGAVTVRMVTPDGLNTMRIEVADTGVGIPAEDLPHMFEKFYRVEANNKMAKGTGLGLNLVKNIVEGVHEGKLSLKSEVGKGSTFTISLAKVT